MASISHPLPPEAPHVVHSRYTAFADFVRSQGLWTEGARLAPSPMHPEEVRGAHLICDSIDFATAAQAAVVTIIPLSLPEDLDSKDAPVALLKRFAGKPQTYFVRGSSLATIEQHKGGTTAVATQAAATLAVDFGLDGIDLDGFADRIDQLLYDERRAGAETERLLLRMLAATRDRNSILELQLLSRPGNLVPVTPHAGVAPGEREPAGGGPRG